MDCFECGKKADFKHHVVPKCLGGTKKVPLCGDCHKKVHSPLSELSIRRLLPKFRIPNKVTLRVLRSAMKLRGRMSLRQAAKQIGVSHDTVSRIWTGKHGIHRIHRKLQEYL